MTLSRIKKLSLVAIIGAVLTIGAAVQPASAQRVIVRPGGRFFVGGGFGPGFGWWGPGWGYGYYGYPYNSIAYRQDQGYHDGFSRGKSDAEHGKAFAPESHQHFSNADSLSYRNAFEEGYKSGYDQKAGAR